MIKIIDILSTEYSAAQPTPVRAHLIADTTSDLPAPTGITGYQLTIGSICDVIADSTRYTMQSSGTWVQTLKDITADVYTKAQVDAMITALQTAVDTKTTVMDIYGLGINIYAAQGNRKDLDTYTTPGRYYAGVSVTQYIDHKPLSTTTAGFQLTVEQNSATTRLIQTVTYNTTESGILGSVYKRWFIQGNVWSAWFKIEGTQLT